MIFTETPLSDAYVVEPEKIEDERGFFARTWDQREFAAHRLDARLVQCDVSFNVYQGTLRGMHFQVAPYAQPKLVRCTMGSIFDVIIDLRRGSSTFTQHTSVVLNARNRTMLYVPAGFAHGFLTLEDNCEVFYQMSEVYAPECARGVRWNDPAFGISWPAEVRRIVDRDRDYPDFIPEQAEWLS